jgi:hypothetical protein
MGKPQSSRLFLVTVLVIMGVAAFLLWRAHEASLWKQRLADALADADSITLDPNVLPEEVRAANNVPLVPTCEIKGHDAVAAFVDALGFSRRDQPCACYGIMRICFRRGGQAIVTLNYAHEWSLASNLYTNDGEWSNAQLTGRSQAALKLWFTTWGGNALADARTVQRRLAKACLGEQAHEQPPETRPAGAGATQPVDRGGT